MNVWGKNNARSSYACHNFAPTKELWNSHIGVLIAIEAEVREIKCISLK